MVVFVNTSSDNTFPTDSEFNKAWPASPSNVASYQVGKVSMYIINLFGHAARSHWQRLA